MLTLLGACQSEPKAPTGSALPLDQIPATVPDAATSPWLSEHWTFPVPAQGPAPKDWTELEASLAPESCGTCHPQQLADWQQSLHHLGMGPGVMGQLVDWDGSDDRTVLQCQTCHAPLTEQLPRTRDGDQTVDNPTFDVSMRSKGLTCAGCHVRHNQRLGPPKDGRPTDADGVALADGPHGGFVPKKEFQSADFCSACHDFKQSQLSLEGKLLQETGPEWRRTDFAAQGVTCQTCHMPDKRHLWKGIHDPEIVAKGVEITGGIDDVGGLLTPVRASLSLANV
ncbi:MAG: hypothetical protein GXP62_16550, partial [Oligoflexia bacterium]|nr:hypothetical protein [Oligoflexia bacterium]